MSAKRMTEHTRDLITKSVHEVDALTKAGETPTAAFIKVATSNNLSPSQIQHAASAYNVGSTIRWMESKTGAERADSFPIADIDSVISSVFPSKVPAPAMEKAASFASSSQASEDTYHLPTDMRSLEKYASHATQARAFSAQRISDEEISRRVSNSVHHFTKLAAECDRNAHRLDLDALSLARKAEWLM